MEEEREGREGGGREGEREGRLDPHITHLLTLSNIYKYTHPHRHLLPIVMNCRAHDTESLTHPSMSPETLLDF